MNRRQLLQGLLAAWLVPMRAFDGVAAGSPDETRDGHDRPAKGGEMSFDETFQEAIAQTGLRYLQAEEKLRRGGAESLEVLKRHLEHPDEVDRLMARCLVDWMEGRAPANQPALDYLQGLPLRIARTPMGVPSAFGVPKYLFDHYGNKVAEILALRLAKQTDWPGWQVIGVLLYLGDVKLPSTTGAVIRFVAETPEPQERIEGVNILGRMEDRRLQEKILAEKQRAVRLRRAFPEALEALLQQSSPPTGGN